MNSEHSSNYTNNVLGPLMNMETNMGCGRLTLQIGVELTLAIFKHIANPSHTMIGCPIASYNP